MRADQRLQRRQRRGAGADPVGQCGDVEINTLPCVGIALPIQRQVLPELRFQDHCQQVRARPAAGDRMEGRRRLGDGLASPAGKLLPHRLHHLPLARDHLQRLGDRLSELGKHAPAAWACGRARNHHPLARQVRRQRQARRLAAGVARGRRPLEFDRTDILGLGRFELLELQLQLVEQLVAALGGGAEPIVPQLGNHQLEMGDHRLRAGRPRLGRRGPALRVGGAGLGLATRRAQGGDIIRQGVGGFDHEAMESHSRRVGIPKTAAIHIKSLTGLSRQRRPPGPLRMSPVDPFQRRPSEISPLVSSDESLAEVIQVLDQRHPLYGRSFRVIRRSTHRGGNFPPSYEVEYRNGVSLLVPISVTDPQNSRPNQTKLSIESLRELIVAAECLECDEHRYERSLGGAATGSAASDRRRRGRSASGDLS